jgi:hypothetical protein
MPTLNEFLAASKTHRMKASGIKRDVEDNLVLEMSRMLPIDYPAVYIFTWIDHKFNADPDNIAFAHKFVFDALQKAGRIPDDNITWVKGLADRFVVIDPVTHRGEKPCLMLTAYEYIKGESSIELSY